MIRLTIALCTAIVFVFLGASALRGHGPLHERIANATRRLEQQPRNASLLVERAQLHREHGDRSAATRDLVCALELDKCHVAALVAFAELKLEATDARAAVELAERALRAAPETWSAHWAMARASAQLGELEVAVKHYTATIATMAHPTPDAYLARFHTTRALGPEHRTAALAGLDEGIARMGPLVTLELPAIETELELGRCDAALERLALIEKSARRKEHWQVLRAEILARAGRLEAARAAAAEALVLIARVRPHRLTVSLTRLEERARAIAQSPAAGVRQ
ncbi:MAG: tetratricopeptide repeat protein [Planctomycetota bacterium]